jgi:hypothetical protein
MLTPRHRALFEASYSALLLRTDAGDRNQPPAPAAPSQAQDPNFLSDKDFGPGHTG